MKHPDPMFSSRSIWDSRPNALSLLLQKKKEAGSIVCDLTESNPTRVGFGFDAEAILSALSQAEVMTYAPDPKGLYEARRAIAGYYREMGKTLGPDALLLTASTSEAYGAAFKLLADPGDEVLIPSPGYPLLSFLARFEGLSACRYPLRYHPVHGWTMDMDVLEALATERTRAVVLVNPNNPTGSFVKQFELERLDAFCLRRDIALVVDEVFSDFGLGDVPGRVPTVVNRTQALTIVLNGFSKMLGLPQLKLAWMAVGGDSGRCNEAMVRLEAMLDFALSVSTPVQVAAGRLLSGRKWIQGQILSRLEANRRQLQARAEGTANCRIFRQEGGWYAIVQIEDDILDEDRVLSLLDKDDVLAHPGFFYGFSQQGIVVVSLLPRPDTFDKGITAMFDRFGRK